MDPFLIAIAGGMGSALGELSGHFAGFYGRTVIGESHRKNMEFCVKIFDRYGSLAIFLFALTPLPDDCLFIPLGVMHYNLFKTLVPCVADKVLMCFILAMGGRLSIAFIRNLLGGDEGILGIAATMAP